MFISLIIIFIFIMCSDTAGDTDDPPRLIDGDRRVFEIDTQPIKRPGCHHLHESFVPELDPRSDRGASGFDHFFESRHGARFSALRSEIAGAP